MEHFQVTRLTDLYYAQFFRATLPLHLLKYNTVFENLFPTVTSLHWLLVNPQSDSVCLVNQQVCLEPEVSQDPRPALLNQL